MVRQAMDHPKIGNHISPIATRRRLFGVRDCASNRIAMEAKHSAAAGRLYFRDQNIIEKACIGCGAMEKMMNQSNPEPNNK